MWVNDRLDEGRRVVELGLKDGRKLLEQSVRDGGRVLVHGLDEGRRVLDHRLREGRDTLDHGLRDGRKALGRGLDDGRDLLSSRYDHGRHVVEARLDRGRRAASTVSTVNAVLWPTLLAAAGAGAAFWWWTQWSRGKAEAEARAMTHKPEGGGEAPIDHAEMVMAHRDPPPGGPSNAVDKADEKLVEPAEQLMMHAPVDDKPIAAAPQPGQAPKVDESLATSPLRTKGARAKAAGGKAEALASVASQALASAPAALEDSLGVQGAATAPKTRRRSPAKAAEGSTAAAGGRKRGPTIM